MLEQAGSFQFVPKRARKPPLQYLRYLPEDYSADRSRKWPLLLFLHGAGERGSDLKKVTRHGPPRLIKAGRNFPFIVVAPQCRAHETWSRDELIGLLENLQNDLRVDAQRIYLTGISMGGYGSWDLALHYPERFAAVAPICGGATILPCLLPGKGKSAALKRLPIWVFHGAEDDIVPLSESDRVVKILRELGNPVKFTVYPGLKHDSWTVAYQNEELCNWFLRHQSRPIFTRAET